MGKNLQWRMTMWVGGSVLLVAASILCCAAVLLRDRFESQMDERMEDAIDWTTSVVDQRMKRVEYATRTVAASVQDYMLEKDERMDSLLVRMIRGLECIDVASLVIHDGNKNISMAHAALAENGKKSIRVLKAFEEMGLEDDPNWRSSFEEGKPFWSPSYVHRLAKNDFSLLCYSEPVYSDDGKPRGMLCAQITEDWIIYIIKKYKVRKDIDVSVFTSDGRCIVPQQDYIRQLDKKDLIQEERSLEHLGWKLVFSADKRIINEQLNRILLWIILASLLLLLTVALTIILTVRYVARPFVQEQRRIAGSEAALQRELTIAAHTQNNLIPHVFPPFPARKEIDLHAFLQPARQVGGDLYDYFLQEDNLYFCIGDVSGKGVPASLFMAATHYLFRSVASNMPLTKAVEHMNQSLCTDNSQCMFVTFWFGCLNLCTGKLEFVNAGHNSPLLIQGNEIRYMAPSGNMPLGILEDAEFSSETLDLQAGDTLFLYTDGLTEAMNVQHQPYGDDAALESMKLCAGKAAKEIVGEMTERVLRYAAGTEQSDDITLLCLNYLGEGSPKEKR